MNAPVSTPLNTTDRVTEMMATLEEFSALLEVETAAVRKADVAAISRLSERKEYLALHYQRQLKMLSDRRADVAELPAEIKQRLQAIWNRFYALVQANMQALEGAQQATKSVVNMIVAAIREVQGQGRDPAYRGSAYSRPATPAADCISVTFNQVL